MAHRIVYKYLSDIKTQLAKFKVKLNSCHSDVINHCVKESSLPAHQALCFGTKVMLLHNFIVDYKLMNGAI